MLANNTSHFNDEEIKRLLAAYKRVTEDRMTSTQFDEIIRIELGWTSPVLRKQLFRAFDKVASTAAHPPSPMLDAPTNHPTNRLHLSHPR